MKTTNLKEGDLFQMGRKYEGTADDAAKVVESIKKNHIPEKHCPMINSVCMGNACMAWAEPQAIIFTDGFAVIGNKCSSPIIRGRTIEEEYRTLIQEERTKRPDAVPKGDPDSISEKQNND